VVRERAAGFDGVREHVLETVRHTDAPFLADAESGVRLFGAPVHPPVHVVVVGASRGAEAFAQATASAGWLVTVVDHRDDALAALTLPTDASRRTVLAEHVAGALTENRCVSDSRTCYALCTHRFDHDLAWLRSLIPTRVPYIGLLGSRQRAARLLRALTESGTILRARDRARVYAPIGLDIGGDSPQAIALAAIAEMHTVLHSRPGGPLRERQAPLHTRSATPSIATDIAMQSCPLPTTLPILHSRERR
jgi:xanthine/CO dehydrogenase XdhC/CoxF family maturation factor